MLSRRGHIIISFLSHYYLCLSIFTIKGKRDLLSHFKVVKVSVSSVPLFFLNTFVDWLKSASSWLSDQFLFLTLCYFLSYLLIQLYLLYSWISQVSMSLSFVLKYILALICSFNWVHIPSSEWESVPYCPLHVFLLSKSRGPVALQWIFSQVLKNPYKIIFPPHFTLCRDIPSCYMWLLISYTFWFSGTLYWHLYARMTYYIRFTQISFILNNQIIN